MIGTQDVFLTFPLLRRKRECSHCDADTEHARHVAVQFFAFLFIPLVPREVLSIHRCRKCGTEVCVTSNFTIHLLLPLALVLLIVTAAAITMVWATRTWDASTRTLAICWGSLALLGLIGMGYAWHKARKASHASEESRGPSEKSFMQDIENGFWVVMPFGIFLGFLLAYVGLPLVWQGEVGEGIRTFAWRAFALCYILVYWHWKRHRLPIVRAAAFAVVFSAIFTDLLIRLLALSNFFVELVCFLATLAALLAGHYWSLALLRKSGKDAQKLGSLLDGVRSGDGTATLSAMEMLGQMLDSSTVRGNLGEIVRSLRQHDNPEVHSKYSHVPDFFQTLADVRHDRADDTVLRQRVCWGSRSITLIRPTYVCCRHESPFGSRTRFITLSEIDPEPVIRQIWGTRWLKASLVPLTLLVISTLAMLLSGPIQPVSWVVFGGLTLLCLIQGIRASGRKQLFYDRYHSQVLLELFVARPSRTRASEFATQLSRAIRGEFVVPPEDDEGAPEDDTPPTEPAEETAEPDEAPIDDDRGAEGTDGDVEATLHE